MVGTGKGAENGILIKSGIALEEAHKINTIVLDKTGTITNGTPVVTDILNFNGFSKEDILMYAASAEKGSEHPLGEAIVKYAEEEKIKIMNIEKFNSITGHGINAIINSRNILIGNKKLMDDNSIKNSNEDIFTELSSKGVTPIFVSIDSEIAGIVGISDVPKKSSKLAIETLKNMGIKVVMITGDNKLTAEAIGKDVGVDEVIAEVLPSDKSKKIEELQNKGLKLAMVGDGINDAPALAQANVGIAIGSGTDIAIESADIVLMKDDLLDVVKTIELSKATIRNIKQNLFWAFGYNTLGIPIAAGILHVFGGPLLNPMIAAGAMSMSSVSVVSNALRLRNFKSKLDEKNINSETKINSEIKKEEIMKKTLIVEGMSCSHCSGRVKKSLEKLPDVISADVNLDTKEAIVEMSSEISDEIFKATIDDAGYEVSSIK
jgi:Cu+-exporting ATPase